MDEIRALLMSLHNAAHTAGQACQRGDHGEQMQWQGKALQLQDQIVATVEKLLEN